MPIQYFLNRSVRLLDEGEAGRRLHLTIYRPHSSIWFRNNLGRILRRDLLPNKYAPLLDYLCASEHVRLSFVSRLDGDVWKRFFDIVELWLWCRFNKLSDSRIICARDEVRRSEALFIMHYGNFTHEVESVACRGALLAEVLVSLPLAKIVHLTHYAYCVETGASNLKILKPDLLVAESNLIACSKYFGAYFSKIEAPFLCLPYTAAGRFQARRPMSERLNKMVVTGSITYKMQDPAFREFFKTQELQPMRRRLFEVASNYFSEMDCLVSDLDSTRGTARPNRLRRAWNLIRRIAGVRTKGDYYKRDMVDIYNNYTMFAVPEEVCGLPAIGFVEGMACGSAYLGLDSPMYRELGMVPGVHYIAYDGSVEHLMAQVREHQKHPERTQAIAEAGREFVHTNLSADAVYGAFVQSLRELVRAVECRA